MSAKKKNTSQTKPDAAPKEAEPSEEPMAAGDAPQEAAAVPPSEAFRALLGLTEARASEPGFARLNEAYQAFEQGDYPTTRQLATQLAEDSEASADAREGARTLLKAVNLDLTSLFIALGCAAVFILILITVY